MSELSTSGNLCLYLGRHETTASGMWVYSRNLIVGLLADGVTPAVIAGGSQEVARELRALLPDEVIVFRPASSWRRRLSIISDLLSGTTPGGLVHGTSNLVPVRGKAKRVVTLHDLLQGYPSGNSFGLYDRARQLLYRMIYRVIASRADLIVTDRAHTSSLISRMLCPSAEIAVLEPPLDQHYIDAAYPSADQTAQMEQPRAVRILAFASSDPRKNLTAVLRALNQIEISATLTVLVNSEEVERQVTELQGNRSIEVMRNIPAAEMPGLYARHDLLVFPSLAEGFGYPAFEALSQGVPVVISQGLVDSPILGKVIDFVFECDPTDVESIATQIEKAAELEVSTEHRCEVASVIRNQLSPLKAARRLRELYRDCIKFS